MITNADGWVAIKQLQTIPHVLTIRENEYAFVVKHNICLAWVRPEDEPQVMAVTRECCGGAKKPRYFYANELDVQRWTQ